MNIVMKPIGYVRTGTPDDDIPRHWRVSEVEGVLEIMPRFRPGLADLEAGQKIAVLFYFHRSPAFTDDLLTQQPYHRRKTKGVFSICSPRRPNPIGLSVLDVLAVDGCTIRVKGVDMFDGSPILDIKPHMADQER